MYQVKVTQSCLILCNTMHYGILQTRILECVAFPLPKGSSLPRDRTQVSCMQMHSLPAEPQGKLKNTGVGSLSLLQWVFPTQESNWGLLHLRQILYQLSYQGSPSKCVFTPKLLCFQKLFTSSRSLAISQVEKIWYHCCTPKFLLTKKNLSNQQVAQRVASFGNLFGVQTEYSGTEAPWRKWFF